MKEMKRQVKDGTKGTNEHGKGERSTRDGLEERPLGMQGGGRGREEEKRVREGL